MRETKRNRQLFLKSHTTSRRGNNNNLQHVVVLLPFQRLHRQSLAIMKAIFAC